MRPDTQINSIAYSSNTVATVCGRYIELVLAPEVIQSGFSDPGKGCMAGKEPESPESIKARSASRARRKVRRLCNCNGMVYMHTLTFAVDHIDYFEGERPFELVPLELQKDRDEVIKRWKSFARKMRKRELSKDRVFRYIAVIELHKGKRGGDNSIKRGCYHVHFASDRLYNKRLLQHIWTHGLCNHSDWTKGRKARDLDDADTLPPVDNPGAYLSKYIGKDAEECEAWRKSYWASQNLRRPVTISGMEAIEAAKSGQQIYSRTREFACPDGTIMRTHNATYMLSDDNLYNKLSSHKPTTKKEIRESKALKRLHLEALKQLNAKPRNEEMDRPTGSRCTEKYIDRIRHLKQAAAQGD